MSPSVFFNFHRSPDKPFAGAIGWIDHCLIEVFNDIGWKHDLFSFGSHYDHPKGVFASKLPTDALKGLTSYPTFKKPHNLTWYNDRALGVLKPAKKRSGSNVLFFHTFDFPRSSWIGNPQIHRFVAYSTYMTQAIDAFLATPLWNARTCADDRTGVTSEITIPFPGLDFPDGYDTDGYPLPAHVLKALDSDNLIGSCLQPGKPHIRSLYAILLYLNDLAKNHFEGNKRYKLILSIPDCHKLYEMRKNASIELDLENILIPVPQIKNPDVVTILKRAKFSLSYNDYAEPFGIHPLESVFHGCPVYTNGSGNNRYLLPKNHGIFVDESEDMYFGALTGYERLANTIHQNTLNPGKIASQLKAGRNYIEKTYNKKALKSSMSVLLKNLTKPTKTKPFAKRKFTMSPFLRYHSLESAALITDMVYQKISPAHIHCLKNITNMSPIKAAKIFDLNIVNDLIEKGAISLN